MTSRNNLVSIITPAYKAARFVGATIASVQAQSYPEWEMIIVDDCSPDDTLDAIALAIGRDPRIRVIRQERNAGPAAARNAAIRAAQGRWIAFLDSDDLWLPGKLERQLQFHRERNCKLTFTSFRRINMDGTSTGRLIPVPESLDYHQLLGNTAIATSTVLVDRDATGDFEMKPMYYDDFGCWLELLRNGGAAKGLGEDLMRYRVVGQSVSRNKRNSALQVWKTYREIEQLPVIPAAWYFVNYAVRGYLKYSRF